VIVPNLWGLTTVRTAVCSLVFTGSPGDRVLVVFDEEKQPWVVENLATAPPPAPPKSGGIYTYTGQDSLIGGSWNFLTHAERVNNVVVPANSIVYLTYWARFDKIGGTGSVYAILCAAPSGSLSATSTYLVTPMGNGAGGVNVYAEAAGMTAGSGPIISGVVCTSGYMNGGANGAGLVLYGSSGAGDPAPVFHTSPMNVGAPLSLVMPAGTYDFGVAWYVDAGSAANRSDPWLCVEAKTP
jgi:hypothetical protein